MYDANQLFLNIINGLLICCAVGPSREKRKQAQQTTGKQPMKVTGFETIRFDLVSVWVGPQNIEQRSEVLSVGPLPNAAS